MIIIRTYSEIDKQDWRLLAETSPLSTWFQTDEAYRFYQSVSDMCAFVYGVMEEDKLVGVIVGYTTQEKCKLKQYFTARTIVVGGPLLDENISESALAMLLQIVKKQQGEAIYIETRNLHDYSRWKEIFNACGFSYQPHLNFHQDCTKENILSSMSESRRRQIKKAIKNGVSEIYGYDLNRTIDDIIKSGYRFNETCQGSVPEAIIAVLESTDFESAIRNAIRLKGDADTQACIAGAIAEAIYGIPDKFKQVVESKLDSFLLDNKEMSIPSHSASSAIHRAFCHFF